MATKYRDTLSFSQRLNYEFRNLVAEQEEALRNAVYCGMTPEVARQCDERSARIAKIGEQITDLSNETPRETAPQ